MQLLKTSTTSIDTNLNALSASLAKYKTQFKVFKKEASTAIVKLANECSQRDLSTIPFTTARSEVAPDRISEQQWKQVNEHIANLHKENQRQFRTLEEQLVQLVEQKIDFQLQGDQLPVIRDELTACASQCNQLQHELVQLAHRVDRQELVVRRLSTSDRRPSERHTQDATHDHFSDLEEIGITDRSSTHAFNKRTQDGQHEAVAAEIADIRKRLQTLSTTTVNACKSLSSGLRDVQKAIIGFYRWADAVYEGMDNLSQSLDVEHPIPRLKLHAEKQQDRR